jgi:tRNA 2-thiocytidine biosynthesis protein TtcA
LPRASYTFKSLNRAIGKAIHRYDMIQDGDRILVGLSGGKDSMTLLWSLVERRRRAPIDYQLWGVYVDPGFEDSIGPQLRDYGRAMGWDLRVECGDHGVVAHSKVNRENPCFFCSRARRRRLFETAEKLGCNKVALGHNKDDLIETLFINICYGGEIATMAPCQAFFQGKFVVIRPLAFADEELIERFARERRMPLFQNPCPTAGVSKRTEIKHMLHQLYRCNRKVRGNIFHAMGNVKLDYLLK